MLLEELTLVETQFHTILGRCSEDLLEIVQVFFLRPSGDDHIGMPDTRLSTNFWKMAGAGAGPNDNRLYRNSPLCVFTTSSFFVASSSSTCKYASDISSFEKCCPPCSLANSSSTLGMGCWSTCSWGLQSLCSLRICALSRSASARRQWVSPIHCGQHE